MASETTALTIVAPFLSVTKEAPSVAVAPGPVPFTITVKNTGLDTAFQVCVVDTVPAPLEVVSTLSSAVVTGRVVAWSLPRLGIGESAVLTLNTSAGYQSGPATVVNTSMATGVSAFGVPAQGRAGSASVAFRSNATLRVYPNPFDPVRAVRGVLKVEGLGSSGEFRLYDAGGLLVWRGKAGAGGVAEWDGRSTNGRKVSPGVYLWVAEAGGRKQRGRLVVE